MQNLNTISAPVYYSSSVQAWGDSLEPQFSVLRMFLGYLLKNTFPKKHLLPNIKIFIIKAFPLTSTLSTQAESDISEFSTNQRGNCSFVFTDVILDFEV